MNSYMQRPNFTIAFGKLTSAGGAGGTEGATVVKWRAPEACELVAAYAVNSGTAIAAGATDFIRVALINGGTAGTALSSMGTAGGDVAGWAARTQQAITLTGSTQLAQGTWIGATLRAYGGSLISDIAVCFDVVMAGYKTSI